MSTGSTSLGRSQSAEDLGVLSAVCTEVMVAPPKGAEGQDSNQWRVKYLSSKPLIQTGRRCRAWRFGRNYKPARWREDYHFGRLCAACGQDVPCESDPIVVFALLNKLWNGHEHETEHQGQGNERKRAKGAETARDAGQQSTRFGSAVFEYIESQ